MLYIVATPIGNLKDISLRALEVLKEVDLILCEDTRVTKRLLNYYNIKTPVLSYHQHSQIKKINYILDLLEQGKNLALVSDSGTPGISDPGNKLIKKIKELNSSKISLVPGPSALVAAASVSGFPMDRFIFMGFPPVKKKRKKFFQGIAGSKYPVIFYESPYRILKSLEDLELTPLEKDSLTGLSSPNLEIVVCRELTKKFETIYRGKIKEIIKKINPQGEFVVVVNRLYNIKKVAN